MCGQSETQQRKNSGLAEVATIIKKILLGCLLIMLVGVVAFALLFALMVVL